MARQKAADQVETLRKQHQELAAKLREAQIKLRQEERERNSRRNELAGSIALREYEANPEGKFAIAFRNLLDAGLTKAGNRVDFGFPPLPKDARATGGEGSEGGNG